MPAPVWSSELIFFSNGKDTHGIFKPLIGNETQKQMMKNFLRATKLSEPKLLYSLAIGARLLKSQSVCFGCVHQEGWDVTLGCNLISLSLQK